MFFESNYQVQVRVLSYIYQAKYDIALHQIAYKLSQTRNLLFEMINLTYK